MRPNKLVNYNLPLTLETLGYLHLTEVNQLPKQAMERHPATGSKRTEHP